MNRCLAAHAKAPTVYSNKAFFVSSEKHYYGKNYWYRCQCVKGSEPRCDGAQLIYSKDYEAFRISDTAAAPTQKPTPMTPYIDLRYSLIGDGYCKNRVLLPEGEFPLLLTNSHDYRYSTDKNRECMNRCLEMYDKEPFRYSNKAFFVVSAKHRYGVGYSKRCACGSIKDSCVGKDLIHSAEYHAYRIYDKRDPHPPPTPPTNPYKAASYSLIGKGQCKHQMNLRDSHGTDLGWAAPLLSNRHDPLYSNDKKRECMMRSLAAHNYKPTQYSNQAFQIATASRYRGYKDRYFGCLNFRISIAHVFNRL